MRRDIGNNAHGNRNELNFVDSINKGLGGLNLNLKEFIKYICKNENIDFNLVTDISAKYESNTKLKQDCYIFIDDKKFYISLKMGSGNSVHQEKCEDFIEYIKKNLVLLMIYVIFGDSFCGQMELLMELEIWKKEQMET
ncbi:hypothetical protein NMU03_00190 [Allocoprobacillus halotolerans]|uniref:PD-(D/E)XK nuclease superfamily protein n=1 Tax=Allocoprobacillus halotolerans TaxID=2944914 RepID=A0ABY5I1P3_9FIRM|nr:hypothetical protein [Allocoprobacillus halotolerans]UTY39293.1 hypothetical protein NMU03_00190 [Allocoprobacillus halotolerans]